VQEKKQLGRFGKWLVNKYNSNPKKFLYTVLIGGCSVAYGNFIYFGMIKPFGELLYYVKDAAFPTTLIEIEDGDD